MTSDKISFCDRRYGMGFNPMGGAFIEFAGDRIWERLTSHSGGYPGDGGPNPKFVALREALGANPFVVAREHRDADLWRAYHAAMGAAP